MHRLSLPPDADVEASLCVLERHLNLQWRTFPSQQGSLCLFSLLEKAARAAMQRRGRAQGGGPTGTTAAGGPPGAPSREDSVRALNALGRPHANKQHNEETAAAAPAAQQQQQPQQQQGDGDGDDPVPQHELMNLLQLPHLAAPKVRSLFLLL